MPAKKKTKEVIVEAPVPELFTTEFGSFKKIRLKDAWGNTMFMIKGKIPAWVKDVDVQEHKPSGINIATKTLVEEYERLKENRIAPLVTKIRPVAALHDDVVFIIIEMQCGTEVAYMQRVFFSYVQEKYPKVQYTIFTPQDELPLIVGMVDTEIVAIIGGLSLNMVRIVAPEELLDLYKEWNKDGKRIDLDSYK